ncbi:MAG: hypothetical protein ACK43M_22430 [Allorhizobium sp.]
MHQLFDSRQPSPTVFRAFQLLVIGGEGLPAVITTLRLGYDDMEKVVALLMVTHQKTRFAVTTLCAGELPKLSRPLKAFRPSDVEIFDAMQWMLDARQTLSVVCSRHGFGARQRRRLLLLLADYHDRLEAALEGVTAIAQRGHGQGLKNSFERPPLIALTASERMRLARNHLHVERLKGGKAPKLKKLMKQFGLTVDEALAVTGRGKDKEFTK